MREVHISDVSASELFALIDKCVDRSIEKNLRKVYDRPNYMTLKEASELLGYSTQTLSKYVKEGLLVNYGIGRKFRFKAEEVNAAKHKIKKFRK